MIKFYRGKYANYKGTTDHKDGIYFATDTNELFMNGKTYTGVTNVTLENGYLCIEKKGINPTGNTAAEKNVKKIALPKDTYTPGDDSWISVEKVGGYAAGTKASDLKGKSISSILDDLLFPTIQPTYVAPSATLKLNNYAAIKIVGSNAPKAANFTKNFSRGSININGTKKQDRSGNIVAANSYIYYNTDKAANKLADGITITTDGANVPSKVIEGTMKYVYKATYGDGPVPKDSKGGNATNGSALTGSSVLSSAVNVYGVYATLYGVGSDTSALKSSVIPTTYNAVTDKLEFEIPAESGNNIHLFAIPSKYTLTKVEVFNSLSNTYETKETSLFGNKSVVPNSAGLYGTEYTLYKRVDTNRNGSLKYRITFNKQ